MSDAKDIKVSAGALVAELSEVLGTWPLYREFRYQATHFARMAGMMGEHEVHFAVLPESLTLFCDHKKCRKEQLWQLNNSYGDDREVYFGGEDVHRRKYTCRNCGENAVEYFFLWKETADGGIFAKVGQHPPLAERIPPSLRKQLDKEDLEFYEKAVRLRNHNLGIGSLAYLRRVVENRTNDLLDVLAEVARGSNFAADELQNIEVVKTSKRFDDKIDYAAKLLPLHLRPGGQNPIDKLHDLASDGLHSKSEEECVQIFDRGRHVFEYVFSELRVGLEEAKKFLEGLKRL